MKNTIFITVKRLCLFGFSSEVRPAKRNIKTALNLFIFLCCLSLTTCKNAGYIAGETGSISHYHFNCNAQTLVANISEEYKNKNLTAYPDTFDLKYKSTYPFFDLTVSYNNAPLVLVYRLYGDDEIISTSKTAMLSLVFVSDGKKERSDRSLSKQEKEEFTELFEKELIRNLPFYLPDSKEYPKASW